MALVTNDQYDFFRQIQIDDNGNLLVSIVNPSSGGTVSGDYLPLSGGTLTGDLNIDANLNISGFTTNIFEGGDASTTPPLIADAGGASTVGYEYNIDGGYCGGAPAPAGNHPYKVYLLSSGSDYTFAGEINVISISVLTGATNVYLPTYPYRDFYVVKDKTGNAGIYPITVSSSGNTINGETDFVINLSTKPSITFLWDSDGYITI